jgi:cytochrome d ubiquinol oxidase subunit II
MAASSAAGIRQELSSRPAAWLIEICALCAMIMAFRGLWLRRFRQARIAAAIQVALIVVGWGIAQYPYLIRPDITIANSAAPDNVAAAIDAALGCGAIVLIPSLMVLFTVFKRRQGVTHTEQASD